MASHDELKVKFLTMVVGKDAAHTPSRLSVRSSTPDATTCSKLQHYHNFHTSNGGELGNRFIQFCSDVKHICYKDDSTINS